MIEGSFELVYVDENNFAHQVILDKENKEVLNMLTKQGFFSDNEDLKVIEEPFGKFGGE